MSVAKSKLTRTLVLALLALGLSSFTLRAETARIPIAKADLAIALETALEPTRIHLDNYGPRHGTSWLEDDSFIELPGESAKSFSIDEYRFKVTRFRRILYYVNDLNSSTIEARANGTRIQLTVHFESQGEEIKAHCIRRRWGRWGECKLRIERDIHLDDSEVMVSVEPVAYQGSISYANPEVTFETDVRIANRLCRAFRRLCGAIERTVDEKITAKVVGQVQRALDKATTKSAVAASVRKTLDGIIDPSWKVIDVESAGSQFVVTVERPDTVDADSVRSLSLVPLQTQITRACPATIELLATIEMNEATHGTGFLRYEDGTTSAPFSWSAGRGQTLTSKVNRLVEGSPGDTYEGWAEMSVEWRGSNGTSYSKTSGRAEFSLSCTLESPVGRFGLWSFSLFGSDTLRSSTGADRRGFGLRVGREIGPNLTIELDATAEDVSPKGDSGEGEALNVDLRPVFWFPLSERLRGSIALGPGWRLESTDGDGGDGDSFAPSASLGLAWEAGARWWLEVRLVERWLEVRGDQPWETETHVGITYHFGD